MESFLLECITFKQHSLIFSLIYKLAYFQRSKQFFKVEVSIGLYPVDFLAEKKICCF